jgi:hypothetical protein
MARRRRPPGEPPLTPVAVPLTIEELETLDALARYMGFAREGRPEAMRTALRHYVERLPPGWRERAASVPPKRRATRVNILLRAAEVDALDRLAEQLGHAGASGSQEGGRSAVLRDALDTLDRDVAAGRIDRLEAPPRRPWMSTPTSAQVFVRLLPEEIAKADRLVRRFKLNSFGSQPGGRAGLIRIALHRLADRYEIPIEDETPPPPAAVEKPPPKRRGRPRKARSEKSPDHD